MLAATLLVFALPAGAEIPAAAYAYNDETMTMSVELWADGKCRLEVLDKATLAGNSVRCSYYVHGSRIHLRVPFERGGGLFSSLEIEHLRYDDVLVFHGIHPALLLRSPRGSDRI